MMCADVAYADVSTVPVSRVGDSVNGGGTGKSATVSQQKVFMWLDHG